MKTDMSARENRFMAPFVSGTACRSAARLCAVALIAFTTAACFNRSPTTTGSIDPQVTAQMSQSDLRGHADALAERHARDPDNVRVTVAYANVLRRLGQRAQAVAVLQSASIRTPDNMELLGAYGRALADVGRFEEADSVLARAHRPERPDWRVLSAQGTVADQLGDHERARGYYQAALRIEPDEPSILSNYGLSLALGNELPRAESKLRRAAAHPRADQRVRQNLALVLGLSGKFDEAEKVLAQDLSRQEVAESLESIRAMMSERNSWAAIRDADADS